MLAALDCFQPPVGINWHFQLPMWGEIYVDASYVHCSVKNEVSVERKNYYMSQTYSQCQQKKATRWSEWEAGARLCGGALVCKRTGLCFEQAWPVEKFVCSGGTPPGCFSYGVVKTPNDMTNTSNSMARTSLWTPRPEFCTTRLSGIPHNCVGERQLSILRTPKSVLL